MPGIETDGLGFNPILQDIGLAIYPPILYLRYLGFSVPFSLSIAGLIANTEGNIWAKIVRPWVLISWVGWILVLGSSGKRFFDAVANCSGADTFVARCTKFQYFKEFRYFTYAYNFYIECNWNISSPLRNTHLSAHVCR
jgi:hypothetical protein